MRYTVNYCGAVFTDDKDGFNYIEKVPHAEVYEQLKQALNRRDIEIMIKQLEQDQRLKINIRSILPDVSPAEVSDILEELGWEFEPYDSNGWEQDTWIPFAREAYSFCLTLAYSGYYWTMELYRSDIDD